MSSAKPIVNEKSHAKSEQFIHSDSNSSWPSSANKDSSPAQPATPSLSDSGRSDDDSSSWSSLKHLTDSTELLTSVESLPTVSDLSNGIGISKKLNHPTTPTPFIHHNQAYEDLLQLSPSSSPSYNSSYSDSKANESKWSLSFLPNFLISTFSTSLIGPNVYPPDQILFDEPLDSVSNSTKSLDASFDREPDFIPYPDDPLSFKHSEFGFDPLRSDLFIKGDKSKNHAFRRDPTRDPNNPITDDDCFDLYDNSQLVDNYLWSSKFDSGRRQTVSAEDVGYRTYLTTYFSYLLLFIIGHLRDALGKRFYPKEYEQLMPHKGYAALNSDFGSFFTRRVKSKLDDCFSRPVSGPPGRTIRILDRTSLDYCINFKFTHTITQALNIASYNYLGFAQSRGKCADLVEKRILDSGIYSGGSRGSVGLMTLNVQAEKAIAKFLGVQDSIVISQGFATNSTTFPALVGPGCLVISDELNHASIRFGARISGAMVRTYKHNNMKDLERVLRMSISQGQTRKLRGWKKILVVVEGLYSMEGSIVDLPGLLRLRDMFKFYLYLDEAHSIGALGPNGRGVCDYYGVDPNRVDIMMGTLTKSFGASGGYIAGNKTLIDHLRRTSHSSVYAESLSPAVLTQIIASIQSIAGEDVDQACELKFRGEDKVKSSDHENSPSMVIAKKSSDYRLSEGKLRLRRLAFNSRYLHAGLRKLGFIVTGDQDSPIVPLLVFQPGKMLMFSRLMLQKYSIVVVIVGYPATPLVSGRVRFCVSACHTKEDIDKVLIATDEIGSQLGIKLARYHQNDGQGNKKLRVWKVEEVIERARELVLNDQID